MKYDNWRSWLNRYRIEMGGKVELLAEYLDNFVADISTPSQQIDDKAFSLAATMLVERDELFPDDPKDLSEGIAETRDAISRIDRDIDAIEKWADNSAQHIFSHGPSAPLDPFPDLWSHVVATTGSESQDPSRFIPTEKHPLIRLAAFFVAWRDGTETARHLANIAFEVVDAIGSGSVAVAFERLDPDEMLSGTERRQILEKLLKLIQSLSNSDWARNDNAKQEIEDSIRLILSYHAAAMAAAQLAGSKEAYEAVAERMRDRHLMAFATNDAWRRYPNYESGLRFADPNWPEEQLAVKSGADRHSGQTDVRPDGSKNPKNHLPENPDAITLYRRLLEQLGPGTTMKAIAMEFTDMDETKAESLLKKIRDYRDGFRDAFGPLPSRSKR